MSGEWKTEREFAKQVEEVGVGRGKGVPGRGNIFGGRGHDPSGTWNYG